ncbi:helix-turn-helix domain-containing protein [Halostreptopolyspora alba]|uniref:Helix-turn-helix domain-containing protein n=1 Tax=Halostreptopolyspora alba TaxID=2487137 RepID=A0A3N0EED4_9ACTN|nr:helix-turn-helix domain-containing protein [Nocardiopsaceae bacterium YIM 96095]
MTTIGQTLAAAREESGHTLEEISDRTRIRRTVLAAMERDDFAPCGGDFYARGHIRAVCREVGIDPAPLVAQFNERNAEAPPPMTAAPGPEAGRRGATAESGAAEHPARPDETGDTLQYAGSAGRDEAGGEGAATTETTAPRTRRRFWPLLIAAAIVVAAVIAGVQVWPERGLPWEGSTFPLTENTRSGPTPTGAAPAEEKAGAMPAEARDPQSPQEEVDDVRVRLRAHERMWIRVTDADGGDVFTGVLTDGSQKDWSHPEELRMHLGNAGAARIEVNGERLGSPGPEGEVANLVFDSEGMRSR